MKNTKKLQLLFEAMLSRKSVKVVKPQCEEEKRVFIIQHIDLDGLVALYSEKDDEIFYDIDSNRVKLFAQKN